MDVVEGLLVLIETIFLVGLKALAMKLSDPFGDDVEDLSLITYVNGGWCSSMRMLNAELPGPVDAEVEEEQRAGTQTYGEAWGWFDATGVGYGKVSC